MYYLVSVKHNRMTARLTRIAVHSTQWMELMMICCGMAMKRTGMLGVNARNMKALTVKMEMVTVTGNVDRI